MSIKKEDPIIHNVIVSKHPLVHHKLSLLRNIETRPKNFRELVREITVILFLDASRDISTEDYRLNTPSYENFIGKKVKDRIGLIPILRSGLGMVEGILEFFPEAVIYHVGMYRDQRSLQPVEYYNKLPNEPNIDVCYVLDPVLATGGTMIATINILKQWGAKRIKVVTILASPEGIQLMAEIHPDVDIHVCFVDDGLDDRGNILPGLGDAGDRQFSTFAFDAIKK